MSQFPIKAIQIQFQAVVENEESRKSICAALSPDNLVNPPMTISMECTEDTVRIQLNHIYKIETAIATINDLFSAWLVSEGGIEKINKKISKEH